jgi:hypothetical protein
MSSEEDAYDSDVDSSTKRTMRRGKRTTSEGQGSSSALRSRKPLRRRQVVPPAPAPAPEEEEEEKEEEDEDDEEEDDEESSDSIDSDDVEGAEGEDSDSSVDSISSGSEDEEEEEEETPRPGMQFTQTDTPHFHTLVPGAGGSEPSQVSGEAPTDTQPSSAAQATATEAPSSAQPTTNPTETLVNEDPIPDSESTTAIPQITSTIVTGDGALATDTGDAAGQISEGGSGPSRGAEVGIVFGTLGKP